MTGMLSMSNLLAWSAQAALLVAAALIALRVLRLDAPAVRYAFLRIVLTAVLVLPFIQPHATPARAASAVVSSSTAAAAAEPAAAVLTPTSQVVRAITAWWAPTLAALISAGMLARLAWIAAGMILLRRLRRAGEIAPRDGEHDELQSMIGTHATIRYVARLGQPVTFGFRRPVVLLPESLRTQPAAIQRAVLAHELWHVRRRDWIWAVVEEGVRAVLWFHPAIWVLVARIQATREEVVDELAILATGSRRNYADALLAYADASPLFAATAFARRRHLVHRMVLISKEAVMSSKRVVVCCAVLAAVVLSAGWYAVQAFPLVQAPAADDVLAQRPGPVEQRARPITPENPVPRRTYYVPPDYPLEAAEIQARGSATLRITLDETGNLAETRVTGVTITATQFGFGVSGAGSAGVDRMVERLPAEHRPAARTAILAFAREAIRTARQWQYAMPAEGPISFPVTITFAPDQDAARAGQPSVESGRQVVPEGQPPVQFGQQVPPEWDGALRVGGNIKAPTKVLHVNPVYPPEAMAARVQGVVIIEARIEPDGTVGFARVLRSIPMLDEAALDAVRQWRFTPTLLNGEPVPVIMTVTVNFTLQ